MASIFSFKILNGGTPDISSAGLLSGQIQDNSGYPYSDNSSILGKSSHMLTCIQTTVTRGFFLAITCFHYLQYIAEA